MSVTAQVPDLPLVGDPLRDFDEGEDCYNGDDHQLRRRMFENIFNHLDLSSLLLEFNV